jgi:pilus assembly protein Flp/PilA
MKPTKPIPKLAKLTKAIPLQRFLRDEDGATAIEYAMIASGVAVAIAAAVMTLGTNVNGMYQSVATAMK